MAGGPVAVLQNEFNAGSEDNLASMEAVVKARAEAERAESGPEEPQCLSGAELMALEFEDRPVVAGLLGDRESLLLVGGTGMGKSLTTDDIALNLGIPGERPPLWGLFDLPALGPVKTLFVQSENSARANQGRLAKMVEGNPRLMLALENIFFAGTDSRLVGSLQDREFKSKVVRLVKQTGAELVVIDPLISYLGASDENDNAALRRDLDQVTTMQDEAGFSVIVVHHRGKDGKPGNIFSGRGASAIADWAANILVLEREDGHGGGPVVIKGTHVKARNYELQPPFWLERTPDLLLCRRESPLNQAKTDEALLVAEVLRDMGGQAESQAALKQAVRDRALVSEKKARGMVQNALGLGLIVARTGAGQATIYEAI